MSRLTRLSRIGAIALRHRLDDLIDRSGVAEEQLPTPLRLLWRISPTRWLPRPAEPPARRLRLALESLGTRIDQHSDRSFLHGVTCLPEDYAEELAKLQDRVPPFPGTEARAKIEASLGVPLRTFLHRSTSSRLPLRRLPRFTPRRYAPGKTSSSK